MKNKGSTLAKEIDEENKREKAIKELLKCKKCIYFDKVVFMCKEKECVEKNEYYFFNKKKAGS